MTFILELEHKMSRVEKILSDVLERNYRLTADDATLLFNSSDKKDIELIKTTANALRKKVNGDKVSYIINLNVNFTNICEATCLFCGFKRSENQPGSEILDLEKFEETFLKAVKDGVTEVCLQGGLYSKLEIPGLKATNKLDMYAKLLSWFKDRHPKVHLHAYSPEEIEFSSLLSGKSIQYVLDYFKDSGLNSMPGTAAEILDDNIRKIICSKKLNTAKWIEVIKTAHKSGIPTTCTMLFGHIESNQHRANHLEILRNVQDETHGFTEYIPLPFISTKTLLSSKVKPLESIDRLKMLSIARIFFGYSIPNIQASWVKQGMAETAESLDWGVNDVGGTLGDERITFEAGGNFGRNVSKEDLIELIESKQRQPILRDTLYDYQKIAIPSKCN